MECNHKCVTDLLNKATELHNMQENLEEKDQMIATLHHALEEKGDTLSQIIIATNSKKRHKLINGLLLQENEHHKKALESERRNLQALTAELKQSKQYDQLLSDAQHANQKLQEETAELNKKLADVGSLRQRNSELQETLAAKDEIVQKMTEKAETQEEKIQHLTAQVNSYSQRDDELKRALTKSQEIYKTLETEKGIEVNELKEKLDNELTSNRQLENRLTILRQEQARVTSLEKEVSKLKDLNERRKNANKTLVQKLKAYEQSLVNSPQLTSRADSIPHHYAETPIVTTAQYYEGCGLRVQASDHELSDSPRMSKDRHNREEQQAAERQRIRQEADDALRELDYARKHGIQAQTSTATTDPLSQTNFMSGHSKEKPHDDDTDFDNESWPENQVGIDQEIQYYAEQVRQMSRRPDTAEVELSDEDDPLPYDPNLVCPRCGKKYRIGGVQKFRRHVKELCTANS